MIVISGIFRLLLRSPHSTASANMQVSYCRHPATFVMAFLSSQASIMELAQIALLERFRMQM
jgi:hypothetical protein